MTKNFSIIFIIIAIIIIGFFSLSYQRKVSLAPGGKIKEEMIEKEPVIFLVLGRMGKVMGWNTAADLTDAIVIVNYRPESKAVNLVSLPRDLYVDMGGERFKLNEVARRDKIGELLKKLPDMTGLSTESYIVVDVDSLKSVVDGLDGIDINLESDVVDNITGFTLKAGQEHLSGEDAIWLVRNRFDPEGDFFREKNQHQVIEAIVYKYRNLNPLEKTSFLIKIVPEFTKLKTNIDFAKFMPMVEKFEDVKFNDIVLDFKSGLVESSSTVVGGPNSTSSMYILVPKNGQDDYGAIRDFVSGRLVN